jgi:hypothetical protein
MERFTVGSFFALRVGRVRVESKDPGVQDPGYGQGYTILSMQYNTIEVI